MRVIHSMVMREKPPSKRPRIQSRRMPRLIWVFAGCTSFCWLCREVAQISIQDSLPLAFASSSLSLRSLSREFSSLRCDSFVCDAWRSSSISNDVRVTTLPSRKPRLLGNWKVNKWLKLMWKLWNEPHHKKICLLGFVTRSDSNRRAQLQRLARVLNFLFSKCR